MKKWFKKISEEQKKRITMLICTGLIVVTLVVATNTTLKVMTHWFSTMAKMQYFSIMIQGEMLRKLGGGSPEQEI